MTGRNQLNKPHTPSKLRKFTCEVLLGIPAPCIPYLVFIARENKQTFEGRRVFGESLSLPSTVTRKP